MSFTVLRSDLESILLDIQHMEAMNAAVAAETVRLGRAPTVEEKRVLEVALLGPNAAQSTAGLRTVSGILNNLNAGHAAYGSADRPFPTATTPTVTTAPAASFDTNGPAPGGVLANNTYTPGQSVVDAQVRQISNLIADQTSANPAAVAAALARGGSIEMYKGNMALSTDLGGGLFRGTTGSLHNANGELVDEAGNPIFLVPNVAPVTGAPAYNGWLALFGQGFDHGLDFINKGGNGTVYIPVLPGDPLYEPGGFTNFMVVTRAAAGAVNRTTPWIDMNQAYASHPAFQVFLREYVLDAAGHPVATGKLLGGANGGMPNWGEIKAQARTILGINLTDAQVGDCPLLATDDFGAFIPGANGMPQVVFVDPTAPNGFRQVEGNRATPISLSQLGGAVLTGHAFLLDIAHDAAPGAGKTADTDTLLGNAQPVNPRTGQSTTYDNELLDKHFIAGDGRVNENAGLTTFHTIFHNEHDRLVGDYQRIAIQDAVASGNVTFLNEWVLGVNGVAANLTLVQAQAIDTAAKASLALIPAPTEDQVLVAYSQAATANGVLWDGNRLFQAARYLNEMEYQHGVLQEFARFIDPNIAAAPATNVDLDPAILSEFASAVYRFGHSMLDETVDRITLDANGAWADKSTSLIQAFLNPTGFMRVNNATGVAELTPEQAGAEVLRGMVRQTGNEIDEFTTGALRNNLVGLPLDLAATNIARGRDVGIPRFNDTRRQLGLREYTGWSDFAANLKHAESSINFIAAYGNHALINGATNMAGKRAAAMALVLGGSQSYVDDAGVTQTLTADFADSQAFLNGTGAYATDKGGLNTVDLWIAGLAEKTLTQVNMLGETFGVIFRTQIQQLQDADRFYYLRRLNGNLLAQIEQNSFTSMALRNLDITSLPGNIFSVPTYTLEVNQALQYTGLGTDLKADPLGSNGLLPMVNRSMNSTIPGVAPTNVLFFNGTGSQHAVLNGTEASDVIGGGDGDDTLYGNGGKDYLITGHGVDIAYGGNGDDIIWHGGAGAVPAVLHGDEGNDVINLTTGAAIAHGGNGKDVVNGAGRDNLSEVFLNAGDDFLFAGTAGTVAQGGVGDDWMEGLGGSDKVSGEDRRGLLINPVTGLPEPLGQETGNDVFKLGQGANRADGELGDDMFIDDFGDDIYTGSAGFDWVTYKDHSTGVAVNLGAIPPVVAPAVPQGDGFDGQVESASGSRFDDVILGDERTDLRPVLAGVALNPLDNQLRRLTNADGSDMVAGLWSGTGSILGGTTATNGLLGTTTNAAQRNADLFNGTGADRSLAFGNLLMGGGGADSIQGQGGNDVIDGDAALKIQIEWRPAGQAAQRFDSMGQIQDALANGVINPGDLFIVREIVKEAGAGDEAVFRGNFREYDIEGVNWDGGNALQDALNRTVLGRNMTTLAGLTGTAQDLDGDGYIRVSHNATFVTGGAAGATFDGVDYVRNVESLRFQNITGAAAVDGVDQILSATSGFGTGANTVRLNPAQSADIVSGFNAATTTRAVAANERLTFAQTAGQGAAFLNTFNALEAIGTTALDTDQNGNIWLRNTATVARVKLTFQGKQVTATQFPGFTFLGARAVTGGYELALANADGSFATWNVNALGAYVSSQSFGSTEIIDKELPFGQDLNNDGSIGVSLTPFGVTGIAPRAAGIAPLAAGTASLATDQKGRLWLQDGASDLRVSFNGKQVSATDYPGWTFIAAQAVNGGYELALKNADGSFGTWTLDSTGLYTGSQGFSATAFIDKENDFGRDLNTDGSIGAALSAYGVAGPAALSTDQKGRLWLQDGASDLRVSFNGKQVSATDFPGWTFIAAQAVNGGYELALKNDDGSFGTWTLDSTGLYTGSQGFSAAAFVDKENDFGRDLNDDQVVGAKLSAYGLAGDASLSTDQKGRLWLQDGASDLRVSFNGKQVSATDFPGWTFIAAQAVNGGYELALKNDFGDYGTWTLDSTGLYTGSQGFSAAAFADIKEVEFNRDLNGDETIGGAKLFAYGVDGSGLAKDNFNRLRINDGSSDVTLKYLGNDVTTTSFGGWSAMAIAPISGSTDKSVLWHNDNGDYGTWQVGADGNYKSSKTLSSYEVASLESTYGIDLNANGVIGSYLGQDDVGYTLGQGVTLKMNGNQVGGTSFTGWAALGAAATANGNQVIWRNSNGGFGVWTTDANGNYQSSAVLNSVQVGAYENLMAEDLNGNKVLDTLRTVESFGGASVSLDLHGGYVLSSAKGVQLLQLAGQQVGENFGGGWNVVGANDTLTGYQVIWKQTSTGSLGYWNTDANGNYLSSKTVNADQLKAFESSFQQDLDASGTGVLDPITNQMVDPLTLVESQGNASLLKQDNGGYVIDGPNGVQFLSFEGTQVNPGTFSDWTLNGVETQGSGYAADWTQTGGNKLHGIWTTNSTGDFVSAKLV